MVRADRFIGSRIAQSENEKFLWWAEGRKFSNVQCDWGARALGNMDITFPPLWTPTAKEVAEIAKTKSEAIVSGYQAGLLNVDTAQKELKKLADETGMFDSISEEEIAANAGKTYQDVTALRDPLAGMGYGGLINAEPESSAE